MGKENLFELISASKSTELSELVSQRISEGWDLYGSPFTAKGQFFQAVITLRRSEKRLRKTSTDR
jgi:hypothetical protein